MDIAMVRRELL